MLTRRYWDGVEGGRRRSLSVNRQAELGGLRHPERISREPEQENPEVGVHTFYFRRAVASYALIVELLDFLFLRC